MLSTEFQKLTGLVLLLRCTLYHRLLGHAMQLMVRTLPVHLSHLLSSSPPALAHCHVNISAHCTDYRAPQIRRSKGLTTKEVSATFTALFTAYCPLLSSIQPRLLRKESSKKQSVVSAKVHLVEVKVPVHMTWKTISMYMPIWRKYFYFFFQLFELKLRRPYTLFKLIKPSF